MINNNYKFSLLCIVMEYADCGDLYKLIKSQKKIDIPLKYDNKLIKIENR